MLTHPRHEVRDAAFCVNGKGFLLRSKKWAYIRYERSGDAGEELFDMANDPKQYKNLSENEEYVDILERYRNLMDAKIDAVLDNDLGLTYTLNR